MGMKFAGIFVVFCLLGVDGQIFNDAKLVRNNRQRGSLNKRPHGQFINEESYVTANTKRPTYIEGGNQWKPLYNIATRSVQSSQKYRTKPNLYSLKYQQSNIVYPTPTDYHQKFLNQPTANFIANQSLLVSDVPNSTNLKPTYKKIKYHFGPKKNYNQQYEVHEDVEDESPSYSTQNQYRYHDNIPSKYNKGTIKPSTQYTEVVGQEKHVHHVHYHDTMDEALKASAVTKPRYFRNFKGSVTSRRPY